MANNRMWLVHNSGARVLLAKYYPSTGWYLFEPQNVQDAFNETSFGHLTLEQREANQNHKGLGVPFPSREGMYGAGWKLELEVTDE